MKAERRTLFTTNDGGGRATTSTEAWLCLGNNFEEDKRDCEVYRSSDKRTDMAEKGNGNELVECITETEIAVEIVMKVSEDDERRPKKSSVEKKGNLEKVGKLVPCKGKRKGSMN